MATAGEQFASMQRKLDALFEAVNAVQAAPVVKHSQPPPREQDRVAGASPRAGAALTAPHTQPVPSTRDKLRTHRREWSKEHGDDLPEYGVVYKRNPRSNQDRRYRFECLACEVAQPTVTRDSAFFQAWNHDAWGCQE